MTKVMWLLIAIGVVLLGFVFGTIAAKSDRVGDEAARTVVSYNERHRVHKVVFK